MDYKTILYPINLKPEQIAAVMMYVNKNYDEFQKCIQNSSILFMTSKNHIERNVAHFLSLFDYTNSVTDCINEKIINDRNYLVTHRSQKNLFSTELCKRRITSTVLEPIWDSSFGSENYTIEIPLDTPIIIVEGLQLKTPEKYETFTEIILPPGMFDLNERQLTFIRKSFNIYNTKIDFSILHEFSRSQSPTEPECYRLFKQKKMDMIQQCINKDPDDKDSDDESSDFD